MRGVVCPRCRTLHEVGVSCPECKKRRNIKYNKNSRDKKLQKFYLSREWSLVRANVLDHYCNADIWMLGLEGKLVACKRPIVHHIYPYGVPQYQYLALAFDNLICVSTTSHNEIHEWYNSGRFEKALAVIKEGKRKFKEIRDGQRYNFGESAKE